MNMLFQNELKYCFRQPVVMTCFVVFPVLAYILSSDFTSSTVSISEYILMEETKILILLFPFLLSTLGSIIFLRDSQSKMDEIIYCTPVSDTKRWFARFFALSFLLFLVFSISFSVLLFKLLNTESILQALFLISSSLCILVLPSILFFTSIVMFLSKVSNSVVHLFFSIICFGCIYLLLASMTGSPLLAGSSVFSENLYNFMLWWDPYGVTAFIDSVTTEGYKLSYAFALNRLGFMALSLLVYYLVLLRTETNRSSYVTKENKTSINKKKFEFSKRNSKIYQLVLFQLKSLMRNKLTMIILIAWPIVMFNEVLSGVGRLGEMLIFSPNSRDALNLITYDLFEVMGVITIAFWTWMVCTRDKISNISEIISSLPVRNYQFFVSQCIVLAVMVILLLVLTAIGSSIAELFAKSHWIFEQYVVHLVLIGLPLIILSIIFICCYHIFSSTLLACGVVGLIVLVKFTPIMTYFGLTHTLWNIASAPLQKSDNFWGFAISGSVYVPYMFVWGIICICLMMISINQSHRGSGLLKLTLSKFNIPIIISITFSLISILIFHNELIREKPLYTSYKRENWQAEYEKVFRKWEDTPQPSIIEVDSIIDFFPSINQASLEVTFTIQNNTDEPISRVLVGRFGNYKLGRVTVEGARLESRISNLNHAIYMFDKPLMPGDKSHLVTNLFYEDPKLWPNRTHQIINTKFSYFRARPFFPVVGFQKKFLLKDNETRDKYGLKSLESISSTKSIVNSENSNLVKTTTLISTDSSHIAVGQGKLTQMWNEGERAYYRYSTNENIYNELAWFTFPLFVKSKEVKGVRISIYTSEKNEEVENNWEAIGATIRWLTDNIVQLDAEQLNFISTPNLGWESYSIPQVIMVNQLVGFRSHLKTGMSFDPRFRIFAFNTAKQWFGYHTSNNGQLFSDSLAKYVELVMLEKQYGKRVVNEVVKIETKRLELPSKHALKNKKPLISEVAGYLSRVKATIIFTKLRDFIGDEVILSAIRNIRTRSNYRKEAPSLLDFVDELKKITPEKNHTTIENLFITPF